MIQFDKVTKCYQKGHKLQAALSNVSFHLKKGEMAFLTGHSGAGKSTLLKLIALLETASRGHISYAGRDLAKIAKRRIPLVRRSMGLIFQSPQLLTERDVFANVALPLEIAGYHASDIARRVRAALDKVGLLGKEKMPPLALSGGEQQRVGIARAIVNKPALLLADEPTGNLDPDLSAEIMQLFAEFNHVGVTVLIATHDLELVKRMRHRQLILREGQLVDEVTVA